MPVQGTWGVGGVYLPDFGFTELLRELAGKSPSAERTTTFNNPLVYQDRGISNAPSGNNGGTQYASPIGPTLPPGGGGGGGGGRNRKSGKTNYGGVEEVRD